MNMYKNVQKSEEFHHVATYTSSQRLGVDQVYVLGLLKTGISSEQRERKNL